MRGKRRVSNNVMEVWKVEAGGEGREEKGEGEDEEGEEEGLAEII